jgi:hypothetical protein
MGSPVAIAPNGRVAGAARARTVVARRFDDAGATVVHGSAVPARRLGRRARKIDAARKTSRRQVARLGVLAVDHFVPALGGIELRTPRGECLAAALEHIDGHHAFVLGRRLALPFMQDRREVTRRAAVVVGDAVATAHRGVDFATNRLLRVDAHSGFSARGGRALQATQAVHRIHPVAIASDGRSHALPGHEPSSQVGSMTQEPPSSSTATPYQPGVSRGGHGISAQLG